MNRTKGPWQCIKIVNQGTNESRFIINKPGEGVIAMLNTTIKGDLDLQQANGNLMAAAPDLLEALNEILASAEKKDKEQLKQGLEKAEALVRIFDEEEIEIET